MGRGRLGTTHACLFELHLGSLCPRTIRRGWAYIRRPRNSSTVFDSRGGVARCVGIEAYPMISLRVLLRFTGTSTHYSADGSGAFYATDNQNHAVRFISSSGIVSTVAGESQTGVASANAKPSDFASLLGRDGNRWLFG